ncbi:MAG TPA: hypothetical protein VK196_00450 [Magnetospirillum sp.]|nr:hypothetical protein [Magnetospirillum sp.]
MRVKVRELARPVGGGSPATCMPSAAEHQALAGLMSMVEGSPLFNGHVVMAEEQERCYRAIGELRRLIADTRLLLPDDAAACDLLAAMRAACRKYLDEAEAWDKKSGRRFSMPTFAFYQLLGAFREVVGLYVWRLGELYDLEVEGRLTYFFPGTRA